MLLSAAAVIGLGATAVGCTPRTEKPAESTAPSPAPDSTTPGPAANPTEKGVRTNVTRPALSVAPPQGGANGAVPCGFGPAGGLPCSSR